MDEIDEKSFRFWMLLLNPHVQEFLELLAEINRPVAEDPGVALPLHGELISETIIR